MDKLRNRDFITMKIFKPQKDNIYRNRVIASVISAIILLCIISAIVFYVINEYEVRLDDTFNCIVCIVVGLCTYFIVYVITFKMTWKKYNDCYMGELKKAYNACSTYFYYNFPRKEPIDKKDYIEALARSCKDFPSFLNIPSYKYIKGLDDYIKDQGEQFRHTDFFKEYVRRFPYAMAYLSVKNRTRLYLLRERGLYENILKLVYGKKPDDINSYSSKLLEETLGTIENDYTQKMEKLESMRSDYPFGVDFYTLKNKATEDYVSYANDYNSVIFKDDYISVVIEYEKNKEVFIKDLLTKDSENVYKVKKQRKEQKELEARGEKKQRGLMALLKKGREELEAKLQQKLQEAMITYNEHMEEYNANKDKSLFHLVRECGWKSNHKLGGVPHEFLFYYYPSNRSFRPRHSAQTSNIIYKFKDGVAYEVPLKHITDYLQSEIKRIEESIKWKYKEPKQPYISDNPLTLNIPKPESYRKDIAKQFLFVCIPASSQSLYEKRCKEFSKKLCQKTGLLDGFVDENGECNLIVEQERISQHLGGDSSNERILYNRAAFEGKHIILFDDIVTSGETVRKWISRLEKLGATVDLVISIGYTYIDSFGNVEDPYTYNLQEQKE